MLIQIKENLIVNSSQIATASRSGNYTEVLIVGQDKHCPHQIWDQDKALWTRVLDACAARGRWISVSERLPPKFVDVPAIAGLGTFFVHRVSEDGEEPLFVNAESVHEPDPYLEGVTLWFELPPPPTA